MGVYYIYIQYIYIYFLHTPQDKSQEVQSGEIAGQLTIFPLQIHLSEIFSFKQALKEIRKCDGAPSCLIIVSLG